MSVSQESFPSLFSLAQKLACQLASLKQVSPELYNCVDPERLNAHTNSTFFNDLISCPPDFETEVRGGRGENYRVAQQNLLVRATGIQKIFALTNPTQEFDGFQPGYKILDALGGDGLLTRTLAQILPPTSMPSILTSDISEYMVYAAQIVGLPTLQQPVQNLLLKEKSIDAVIIAYGSHHIPLDQRLRACQEAHRVLKRGGRIVFHDFETGSPVEFWFSDVVDRYSQTGHQYPHFSKADMEHYLSHAGFEEVAVHYLYDPFIIQAPTQQEAIKSLGMYVLNMYGLVKLIYDDQSYDWSQAYQLARQCFRFDYASMNLRADFGVSEISFRENNVGWLIEMPRVALVATGIRL